MLPTLRKLPACTWIRYSRRARPATFIALALAAVLTPAVSNAQRNKKVVGITTTIRTQVTIPTTTSTSVLTYHNDNQRTGLNATETAFVTGATPNLSAQTFGKIWSRPVDGTIYTQPLYVPNVRFPNAPDIQNATLTNGVYNAVFVCTTHNSVYAFDAGSSTQLTRPTSPSTAVRNAPLWQANFNFSNAQVGPVPITDIISEDLQPEIGIIGTPVIDAHADPVSGIRSGTLYVVVKTKEGNNYAQRLHALDLATGKERTDIGSPMLIQASVRGNGDGSLTDPNTGAPTIFFDPQWENQEAALTLVNGGTQNALLYVAWGSHGDNGPFHGWVMAFTASNLQLAAVFNTTPNGDSTAAGFPAGGGIWQGGAGPAVDENGSLFLATGVGDFNASPDISSGGTEYGNSVLKLMLPSGASSPVLDYFTPNNWQALSTNSLALGSGGVMVLPPVGSLAHPNLAVAAGTEGTIYLLNRDTGSLGQFAFAKDNVVQSLPNAVGPIFGLPAYFNNTLYYQGTGDVMKAFQFQTGVLNTTPVSQSTTRFQFPGATPEVTSSSDGSNGIVWALERFTPPSILPGFGIPEPAPYSVLHAYDATDLTRELFGGLTMGTRDIASSAVFTPPTIVNGRAYTGGNNELIAYGFFASNGVTPKPIEADHYVITGPQSVAEKTGNWYSITAIGPDGNPIKLTGTVHLSIRTFGGPSLNITTLNFNGKSNVVFQYAFLQPGLFEFYANDDDGHSTYVPDIDLMPFNTLFPEIFVNAPDTNGPDHLIVKAPTSAKAGSKVTVQVTVVTPTNAPFTWQLNGANIFVSNVGTAITLPDGTQGAVQGLPVYAYGNGPNVPFKIGSSIATMQVTVPGVGNHVIIVSGTVQLIFGTVASPTLTISYPLTGTASIVGVQ